MTSFGQVTCFTPRHESKSRWTSWGTIKRAYCWSSLTSNCVISFHNWWLSAFPFNLLLSRLAGFVPISENWKEYWNIFIYLLTLLINVILGMGFIFYAKVIRCTRTYGMGNHKIYLKICLVKIRYQKDIFS